MSLGDVQAMSAIGVDLIRCGKIQQAASVYAEAVSDLSSCVLSPKPFPPVPGGSRKEGVACNNNNNMGNKSSLVDVYASEDPIPLLSHIRRTHLFFPVPFMFECSLVCSLPSKEDDFWQDRCATSDKQHSICAICCLFNLGLCFHLQWELQQEQQQRQHQEVHDTKAGTLLLQRALRLYEQAISLTTNCGTLVPNDSVLMVLMAICVNASHCHYELMGGELETEQWNQKLKTLLQFSSNNARRHNDEEEEECCNGDEGGVSQPNRHFFTMISFFNCFRRTCAPTA